MLFKKLAGAKRIKDQPGVSAPPGQFVTNKWPVMTFGNTPSIDLDTWRFDIFGLVDEEVSLSWKEFTSLPSVTVDSEFHCVTQWSRLENIWEGVACAEVLNLVEPRPEAAYIMAHCYGGYTTNLALDALADDDALFAYKHDGAPLDAHHGGPLRLVVPKRYGWKSAKWINGIELMAHDRPGFWEQRGYHMEGDPWKEERFGSP